MRFTSASDGSFRLALPPGTYRLEEVVANPGAPPSLKPVTITVSSGTYSRVVLLFDTGIR
jgi:Prealbumin-like fold domain